MSLWSHLIHDPTLWSPVGQFWTWKIAWFQLTIKVRTLGFADWAKTYNHNHEIMRSFDVNSLFTNVALDETIQICLTPTLPRSVLKVLLEFATKKSHFIFNAQYYDQIDCVAMDSPLGPVLANIFTCHFEEKWVLNNNSRPSVRCRYVDDTFTLFDNKNTATQFLHYLNNCHANIKFTVELERTAQSLSWTFSSNDTITLSQHLFTERRPLPACTRNRTPSHQGNTK